MLKGSHNIKKRLEELHQWQKQQQENINDHHHVTKLYADQNKNEIFDEFKENCNCLEEIPKQRFLKKGEGLKNRFKIDPDSLRLHNLPKYKYAKAYKKNDLKLNIDSQINKKHKINNQNLTDAKNDESILNFKPNLRRKQDESNEEDSACESFSAGQEFKYVDLCNISENINMVENIKAKDINCVSGEFPTMWAKVFNSCQANSFPQQNFPNSSLCLLERELNEMEHTSMLKVIKKKAHKNFNLNAGLIQNLIQEKAIAFVENFKDFDGVKQVKKTEKLINSSNDDEDKFLTEFIEISSESRSSILSENDNSTDDEHFKSFKNSKSDIKQENQSDKGHVHFSDEVKINQVNIDPGIYGETPFYNGMKEDIEFYNKSEDYSGFEKFKKNLFDTTSSNNDKTSDDVALIEQILEIPLKNNKDERRKDVITNTELLKNRLVELENEISTFRKNNSELSKLKQEHELNRIQLEQERLEMQEKFNDEKIKYEIHLHDERLNIEEERRKLEKVIRDQKAPNKKEKSEILKLKEEIEDLQKELKKKDSNHVAAQARLRAQIRNFEKEVKILTFEIENLKKENKKLESENARMIRQNNNKILQEINRTIAKLTVKPTEVPETIATVQKQFKPVHNEIISHKRKPPRISHTHKLKTYEIQSFEKNSKSYDTHCDENNSNSSLNDEESILSVEKKRSSCNSFQTQPQKEFSKNLKTVENGTKNYIDNKFKREIEHPDGSKDIWYSNGNLKKISSDGMNIKMLYFNKDIKETNISEGTVRYYYADKNTWHTTYLDGLEILEFPDGQTEHRHKNGTIEVHFPNGSIRVSNSSDPNKLEEWRYADGTSSVLFKNGDKILSFPNGQKEIHTKIHKRREYPDGTVKIVYPDGSQETRYSNGRIRLKDRDGNLIMDSLDNNF